MLARRIATVATVSALALFAAPAIAHQAVDKRLLKSLRNVPEQEISDPIGRIRRGKQLFESGTFNGNGRTCATCHGSTEEFALSPSDVAARPETDPLFVFKRIPGLLPLENETLLRQKALICENLDGFDAPCVFRGVPHTLGLSRSIQSDRGNETRAPFPLANATGWSGDGAPNDGSFRNFALGAIVQHFPKDLRRRPGIDFRLPTQQELRQMEAFQLSLGVRSELNLAAMTFRDPTVTAGKALFLGAAQARDGNTRACNGCHTNAGANDADGNNRMFNTGVALHPNAPGCLSVAIAPGDGGFRPVPVEARTVCADGHTETFRGDGTFNTPSLVHAAATTPSFHNNIANTIEDAVRFYTSDTFNASPAGGNRAFVLNENEVRQVGALLRAINARQNVIDSIAMNQRSLNEGRAIANDPIGTSIAKIEKAIEMLTRGPARLYPNSNLVGLLRQDLTFERQALAGNRNVRRTALNNAIARKTRARGLF